MSHTGYPRGSEWSKWDLHVHTPDSIVQEYGGSTPEAWEKFINDLENLPPEFTVIGINYYIFLSGYRKVLEYKAAGRLANLKLILPVIELRVDKYASLGADDPWKKVNFHVIFSEQLAPDVIENHFIKAVVVNLKIEVGDEEEEFNDIITPESLAAIGKRVKETSTKEISGSDLKVGFYSIAFSYEEVLKKLKTETFKGKILTAVGKSEWDTMRWDGSATTKKTIINKADFVFTALDTHVTYEAQKAKLTEQKVNDKLLDCSDAHKFSDNEKPERRLGNCFTWLKANPTFDGLKQVSKDASRIYVGEIPSLLKRVKENPTKYIRQLTFTRTAGSTLKEIWFDSIDIPVNPGLVAIIGNKGNGKSALADVIGLGGNTKNVKHFSFLDKKKFRAPGPNRSESFDATLTWETGSSDKVNLATNPNSEAVENVKYLPQGFLEALCNEDHDEFDEELKKVIFNHIPDARKFGKSNLEELETHLTTALETDIVQITEELRTLNDFVIALERKEIPSYKAQLENSLIQRRGELQAHDLIKPAEVPSPTDPVIVEKSRVVSEQIATVRAEQDELDQQRELRNTELKKHTQNKLDLNNAIAALKTLQGSVDKTIQSITPVIQENSIPLETLITYTIKVDPLTAKVDQVTRSIAVCEQELNELLTDSVAFKLKGVKQRLSDLKNSLDGPVRDYQHYLTRVAEWAQQRAVITGKADAIGSLTYIEHEINYVNEKLAGEVTAAQSEREKVMRKLFLKKNEMLEIYRTFYKPITEFITTEAELLKTYEIQLDIENELTGFDTKFLAAINAGSRGSFIGIEEGREVLSALLEKNQWASEDTIVKLVNEIVGHLKFDIRPGAEGERRDIDKQLKSGYTVTDLYDFLFGLKFLKPTYRLKLNSKNLAELSPGERGALLLIFYLALDKKDTPLVIDQPEENLDNQSVFKLLAQFLKKAKDRRQVLIVTHNPNLAVVCDADQIIHVRIEKHNQNKVIVNSGGLENKTINATVVDILEGTYDAFDIRDVKYKVITRPKK